MIANCPHPALRENVTAQGHWRWERRPSGDYVPVDALEVDEEESHRFFCLDCGADVYLDDDLRLIEGDE